MASDYVRPEPPQIDVRLHYAPAGPREREETDQLSRAIYAALDAAGGPALEARLQLAEPRMLEWLADPERAAAFALDPLGALERLDAPVEPELIAALRRMSTALAAQA